jgi:hypothetical protein
VYDGNYKGCVNYGRNNQLINVVSRNLLSNEWINMLSMSHHACRIIHKMPSDEQSSESLGTSLSVFCSNDTRMSMLAFHIFLITNSI